MPVIAAAAKPVPAPTNAVVETTSSASTETATTTSDGPASGTVTSVPTQKISTPMELARLFGGPFVVYISGLPHTLQNNVRLIKQQCVIVTMPFRLFAFALLGFFPLSL